MVVVVAVLALAVLVVAVATALVALVGREVGLAGAVAVAPVHRLIRG